MQKMAMAKKSQKSNGKLENYDYLNDLLTKLNESSDEKDKIGHFLLDIYNLNHIPANGLINKRLTNDLFRAYVAKNGLHNFENLQIGSLLRSNKFLLNTERGSSDYKIFMTNLYQFRNNIIKSIDTFRIEQAIELNLSEESANKTKATDLPPEIDTSIAESFLHFEGSNPFIVIDDKFKLSKLGCYICQRNFRTQVDFESHIEYHTESSDFDVLNSYSRHIAPIFQLSYNICKHSSFLCFTLATSEKEVIVEKIILVGSCSFLYIKDHEVPYPISPAGLDNFFIDQHMFTVGLEEPIVVVYRYKGDSNVRRVEQHHFLRIEDFPSLNGKVKIQKSELKFKTKLQNFYPSKSMRREKIKGYTDAGLCRVNFEMSNYIATKTLTRNNYESVLTTLLEMEDIQIMDQYVKLSQKGVQIVDVIEGYYVKLDNLPVDVILEELLSPMDEVILFSKDNKQGSSLIQIQNNEDPVSSLFELPFERKNENRKRYHGSVVRTFGCKVYFTVKREITNAKNTFFDIIFRPSRINLIYQYEALKKVQKSGHLKDLLFPEHYPYGQSSLNDKLQLFNTSIARNPEQLQAVTNIVRGTYSNVPYIIVGPPGTGKTSIIVETVLQLWERGHRILITAGSNSACDEIATRICKKLAILAPELAIMLRIFAVTGEKRMDSLDSDLIKSSNLCSFTHFYPSLKTIEGYKIIVATLSVVGKFVAAGIDNEFFSHVFIDECAASSESEALVGIAGILSPRSKLILSGDPKQLGPILQSDRAKNLGFDRSLMERLMTLPLYKITSEFYNSFIQTRLVRNFRSHPKILQMSSDLYYDGKLRVEADTNITNWALEWHKLPNRNVPIVFHSVTGRSERVPNSRSLFNRRELEVVLDYVKDIMYFGINGQTVKETDIGIISPYKLQYSRIQEELIKRHWYKIDIGSVETFQGKEKKIIIASMVRSSTKSVGFLDNPKRLNVTLSRAQAVFILIGNPQTLAMVDDWKNVIDYCVDNKAMAGTRYNGQRERTSSDTSVSTISHKISGLDIQSGIKYDTNNENGMRNVVGIQGKYDDVSSVEDWLSEATKWQEKQRPNLPRTLHNKGVNDDSSLFAFNLPDTKKNVEQPTTVSKVLPLNKHSETELGHKPPVPIIKSVATDLDRKVLANVNRNVPCTNKTVNTNLRSASSAQTSTHSVEGFKNTCHPSKVNVPISIPNYSTKPTLRSSNLLSSSTSGTGYIYTGHQRSDNPNFSSSNGYSEQVKKKKSTCVVS